MDEVFKALADVSRRRLLDSLNARNGQSLRELCAGLDMARQSVSKHLAVLEAANLVTTVRHGREKLHHLNAEPINAIAERWINQYDRARVHALADLKKALESVPMSNTDNTAGPEFVYTTYINTTPKQLWQALTEPAFTRRYWGTEFESDWQVGSPLLWQEGDQSPQDLGQVVLESDPYRRLSYSWHNYQPMHAKHFGWSEAELAELVKEKLSKVTFDIEEHGSVVRLTVTHDGFEAETKMYQAVSGKLEGSGGWPELLAGLKTLLETGDPLPEPS
ncbi:ArsR/SmtB family transcription factor [Amycolatopsis nigrescens]|uniref:ArsR/SmtB family transcription factor n=1 Tax=Amycolatopsis nigrescens TaxID=381445 RepID=UPI00035CC008|nr:metalloregulator ArsR/SmtB family transcription factor [Amycolatopsis nigrescens]